MVTPSHDTLATQPSKRQRIAVSGIPVDLLTCEELIEEVLRAIQEKRSSVFTYANVHTANLANKVASLRRFLWEDVSVVFCDGFGILLGARILGYQIHADQRMTGPDFFEALVLQCAERGVRMYLLAGEPGVTDLAILKLATLAPSLRVSGHHGFFQKTGPENDAVVADILANDPGIVCLGFGSPLQELWIEQNRSRLGNIVFLPLGAWLDFYTGTTWRGPRWLTDHGFEWLCRLFTQPQRLWKRYLIGNPQFLARVLYARISSAGAGPGAANRR